MSSINIEKLNQLSEVMELLRHSPERALRIQAGVEPLHKGRSYTSPERAAEGSVTPSGFMCITHGIAGASPLPVVLTALRA